MEGGPQSTVCSHRLIVYCLISFVAGLLLTPQNYTENLTSRKRVQAVAIPSEAIVSNESIIDTLSTSSNSSNVETKGGCSNENVEPIEKSEIVFHNETPGIHVEEKDFYDMVVHDGSNIHAFDPINYLRRPQAFVKVFRECTADPDCYFTYLHISKTGGTTVEQAMFPLFQQEHRNTCCHSRLLEKFNQEVDYYCTQKFTSWQVNHEEFWYVLQKCQEQPRLATQGPRRTVILTTYREPIATFLSLVHQICNKNFEKRTSRKKRACQACDYDVETKVWEEYVAVVERQLTSAYLVAHWLMPTSDHKLPINTTTILTIEANDLDAFWHDFQPNRPLDRQNPEKLELCSFRPTTELLKALRPAENIYRRLVAGRDFDAMEEQGKSL